MSSTTAIHHSIGVQPPAWLRPATTTLMDLAEQLFGGASGPRKRAWVRTALRELARTIDVPGLPEGIERAVEDALIDVVIEAIWEVRFRRP